MERGRQKTKWVSIALVAVALLGNIFGNGTWLTLIVVAVLAYFLMKGIGWIRILMIVGRALGLLPSVFSLFRNFSLLTLILLLLNIFILVMLAFDKDIKEYFKYSKIK